VLYVVASITGECMIGANQCFRHLTIGFLAAFVVFAFAISGSAQTVRHTEDTVDSSLRSNINVDPSTLNMSFSITLGGLPGRRTKVPLSLSYSSKAWEISFNTVYTVDFSTFTESFPYYARKSVSGWTVDMGAMGVPELDTDGNYSLYDIKGEPFCCSNSGLHIDRIAFRMPDGSTRELRKSDIPVVRNPLQVISGTYVAVDDPHMKYDADNRVLYMADGSRYTFNCCPGGVQYVQYIDRNGNVMNFNTRDGWTDTVGRQIGVSLNNNLESGQESKQQYLTLPGTNGATHTYTLVWKNLDKVLSSGGGTSDLCYFSDFSFPGGPTYAPFLFRSYTPDQINGSGRIFNPVVLSEVILPNGQKYSFTYNVYGEIDKIQLPTGGYHTYEYARIPALDNRISLLVYGQANRGVIRHSVSESGNASDERTWHYSVNPDASYIVTETGPDNARVERYIHRENDAGHQNFGINDARTGRVYDERVYTPGNTMIRRTLTEWARTIINYPPGIQTTKFATRNPRPVRIVEILLDTGGNALSKTTTMNYDADLNVIARNYYNYIPIDPSLAQTGDIGSIPQGALLKTEELTYLVNDPGIDQGIRDGYRSRNLLSLPTKSVVKDGSGTVVSAAQYNYDESAYPLSAYPAVINWADPQSTYRGNVTTKRNWVNVDSGSISAWVDWNAGNWITTHSWYDQCGNVVRAKDGRGGESVFSYSDNFDGVGAQNSYAYLTSASNAIGHTTTLKYDYHTGLVVEAVDPNGTIARKEYSDPFDRPTRSISAYGTSTQNQQMSQYDDANRRVIRTSDLSVYGDNILKSEILYDGLGRVVESRKYEDATSYVRSFTEYDALGRPQRSSNQHRPGESIAWTTTVYDSLGRVVDVETPDGAHVITQYSGNQVTVTDQAGKKRRSETDALGRVAKVIEDPNGAAYQTNYSYDTLGNLTEVSQGGQHRYFLYDSLAHLARAKNPEQSVNGSLNLTNPPAYNNSWSLAYSYDANGNLFSKTDARNITTTYGYDALNRNTSVTYSDSTPGITRTYDTATLGKGRLQKTETAMGSRVTINEYDAMGRLKSQSQQFFHLGAWGTSYTTQQDYDLAGNVKTLKYPSLHTATYTHDQVGRLSSFSGNLGGGAAVNYATGIQYNSFGLKSRETYGTQTPLYLKLLYNSRMQLADLRLSSINDDFNWNRGALTFYYGPNGLETEDPLANNTQNNGNVWGSWHYAPKDDAISANSVPMRHYYYYDALNRISAVRERQRAENGQWADSVSQAFSYDEFGNRTLDLSGGSGPEGVWVDDALPAGAVTGTAGGDSWNWVSSSPAPKSGSVSHISNIADWSNWSPPPYSGNLSHQSTIASGFHQHQYFSSPTPVPVRNGGTLYAYIYIDPENPPQEVMLQWGTNTDGWEHRAYWGDNVIGLGTYGTASRKYMGPLPQAGGWVRLEVPASAVGLEGMNVGAMAFTLHGGRASWDLAGISGVNAWDEWLCVWNGWDYDCYWQHHADYENYVLVDDSFPAGAASGADGGDSWNWRGANNVDMLHQHYFYNASDTLQVIAGDKLFAWVYLDPANPPKEVMLQWNENGSWEHRAYWGQDLIGFGGFGVNGPGHKPMGSLPQAGGWVKLEIPASAVGLEGKIVNGMAFTLYGGRAAWDKAGKVGPYPLAGAGPPINNSVYTVDSATNRLATLNGFTVLYDAAGNQTNDGSGLRTYDAENRMVTATNGGVSSNYTYDADGQRARRNIGGQETWQVYGIGGELLAEYAANGASNSPQKEYGYRGVQLLVVWDGSGTGDRQLQWLVQDHLGSTRMVVDRSGSLGGIRRHDYAPFGEELVAGVIRASNGYGGDSVRQKFDGYERDDTGLDFVHARYYSNIQGRFTSPDAPFADQFERDPQSWNLYAFVRNNPCANTDPSGRNTCYYSNGDLIGCAGDPRIKVDAKAGTLTFTPKKGAAPIVYDLNKVDAEFKVRSGSNTAGDFIAHMSMIAPSAANTIEKIGIVAGGIIAAPIVGPIDAALWVEGLINDDTDAEEAAAAGVTISPLAPDWAQKGAHVKASNGVEVAIRPGMNGEISVQPVFSSTSESAANAAIKEVREKLARDPAFRQRVATTVERGIEYLGKGSAMARARSGELKFLLKALLRMK
jgi:RHS repeat-associated protein